MSSLPQEVIVEIFSWLPVKSLLRFRSVSKTWRTLISNPHFINSHLNRSIQTEKLSIFFKHGRVFSALHSPINFQSLNPHPCTQFEFPFHIPTSITEIVGSCNGLLCLSTFFTNTIYLFNPSTRSYAQLPESPSRFPGHGVTRFPVFGFGYSPHTNQYKLLRIVYFHPPGSTVGCYQVEVKIHTVNTNSWRSITYIPGDIRDRSSGILVNNHLHWIATRVGSGPGPGPGDVSGGTGTGTGNVSGPPTTTRMIVSFDIGNEQFGNITLPQFDDGICNIIFLVELRGCLCMFRKMQDEQVEIWVMKEYGVAESWFRQFTITQPTIFGSFHGWYFKALRYLQSGEFLVRRSNGKLVVYNPRSESCREVVVHDLLDYFVITDYVESLVSFTYEEPQCV